MELLTRPRELVMGLKKIGISFLQKQLLLEIYLKLVVVKSVLHQIQNHQMLRLEDWALTKLLKNQLVVLEMQLHGRTLRISWIDCVSYDEVLIHDERGGSSL